MRSRKLESRNVMLLYLFYFVLFYFLLFEFKHSE